MIKSVLVYFTHLSNLWFSFFCVSKLTDCRWDNWDTVGRAFKLMSVKNNTINRTKHTRLQLKWIIVTFITWFEYTLIITIHRSLLPCGKSCNDFPQPWVWDEIYTQTYVYSNLMVSFIWEHLSALWSCVIINGCVVSVFSAVGCRCSSDKVFGLSFVFSA